MNQLAIQKIRLTENLANLYMLNDDLEAKVDNLSADPDTISIYAHELGYISDGEHLIKLAGFSGGVDRKLITGTALTITKPRFLSEWVCKLLAIISGLTAFFLCFFVFSEKKNDHIQEFF